MLKIVVGSKNPVKVSAAKTAITEMFALSDLNCVAINAPSGVPEQPMNTEETRIGAINRVKYCQQHCEADYYLAFEGGVDQFEYGPATFAFVAIANQTKISIGRSCHLPLPPAVYSALQRGEELGHVMDRLFNTDNIKQKGGAIGLLTKGLASRESVYRQATLLALAPFVHPELYSR
ncbi:MAG: inosine/xanthosine triphosphatase [Paraglaciecola sp.]|uniref:inosine/xanthosine triphosphatase n=1 Tax=Paraglaciecola sp. TaxID=1920173 RepID=UPI0032981ED2